MVAQDPGDVVFRGHISDRISILFRDIYESKPLFPQLEFHSIQWLTSHGGMTIFPIKFVPSLQRLPSFRSGFANR